MYDVFRLLDTSAILNENYPIDNDIVSSTVLREIENIKTSGERKNAEVKHTARKVARYLLNNPPNVFVLKEDDWNTIKKKYSFADTGDNRIIAELIYLTKQYEHKAQIVLWTSDICLFLLAEHYELSAHFCSPNEKKGTFYAGYKEMLIPEDTLSKLYSDPNTNSCGLLTNEYCVLKDDSGQTIDVIRWTGQTNEHIASKNISNKFIGDIHPLDIYQKTAFDLLSRRDIPVKLIQGRPGSGKSFIMISKALDLVMKHEKEKIIFIRNLIDLKDSTQIGALPGEIMDKIGWGSDPIKDIVGGDEGYNYLMSTGAIEQVNLGFIRGRNFGPNYIIYVTEGQNLTESAMQSIVSRAAEGTEVWIDADLNQIDKNVFHENNGVLSLQQNLKGHKLFGATYLPNSHRSAVAELSGLLTSYAND